MAGFFDDIRRIGVAVSSASTGVGAAAVNSYRIHSDFTQVFSSISRTFSSTHYPPRTHRNVIYSRVIRPIATVSSSAPIATSQTVTKTLEVPIKTTQPLTPPANIAHSPNFFYTCRGPEAQTAPVSHARAGYNLDRDSLGNTARKINF